MNKKIIGAILCVSIMITGAIPVMGMSSVGDIEPELIPYIEEILESSDETYNKTYITTTGPVCKLFSKVTITKGLVTQVNPINRYLRNKLIRHIPIFRIIPIYVENLSFTVEYKRDIMFAIKFSCITQNYTITFNESDDIVNETHPSMIINEMHTVTVENMTGVFLFYRARLFDGRQSFMRFFWPARFAFIGLCDNMTITEPYKIH